MPIKARAAAALAATLTAGVAVTGFAVSSLSAHADSGENRIIGGEQTDNPWVVQLVMQKADGKYGCSGEAIAPEWVLTAQHCIRKVDTMTVYYSNDTKDRGPGIVADKMIASPKGDVALLHLSQAHPLAEYGKLTAGYKATAGDRGEIQGYGLTANKGKPTHLNKASVRVLGASTDAFFGRAVHIQGVNGGSNHGDSGGPLIINGVIVGVCSTGDTADPGSNIHATSNYANISASLPWIKENSGVGPADGSVPNIPPSPLKDDAITLPADQTSLKYNVLANDNVKAGTSVTWSGVPAGPGIYIRANRDGSLNIWRESYRRGTYTFNYTVLSNDGDNQSATVTLNLQ